TRKKESGLNRISDDSLRFKIFPNPVKELLQLTLPTTNNNIKIVDVQGKIVLQQTVEQTATINISHLPSGTYIITANEETQQFIKE
ncbi:MAG TPA: T9SS type A sorting domain-containing protein, partial [Paludibacteraceae bacterium]|nr:T9SS type A sorting domain-containing protein [Paludibacteraceae bacterium]